MRRVSAETAGLLLWDDMKEFARKFYHSKDWERVRRAAIIRDHGMCQYPGCNRPMDEVHHITPLTPDNIGDPKISLNLDNLMCVCRDHHFEIHRQARIEAVVKANQYRPPHRKKSTLLQAVRFKDGVPVLATGKITMVCGLIGAGKSTWAEKNRKHITDLDDIPSRSKTEQILKTISLVTQYGEACHITCYPSAIEMDAFDDYDIEWIWISATEAQARANIIKRGRANDLMHIDNLMYANRKYMRMKETSSIDFIEVRSKDTPLR